MISREAQPRSTAEKKRFSTTAVQAIHQRLRYACFSVGAMVAETLSPTNLPPAAVDTRSNTESPRRFHTPDLLRPRIPIPNRIHAGCLPCVPDPAGLGTAGLTSSAPSKEAVDLGTVLAPQIGEAGKPGHGLRDLRS